MILVVGATGRLGGAIASRCVADGRPVRALVRDGSADTGRVAGQPVLGDLQDRASLDRACSGVDVVVATATAAGRTGQDTFDAVDDQGYAQLIEAAASAGVGRFVYVSALGADPESPSPLLRAKGRTEQRLRESGMRSTIIQPDIYMDVMIPIALGPALASDRPVPLVLGGSRRHSWVALGDVAALATAVIDRPDAEGRVLAIGGPVPISWQDIVDAAGRILGHPIPTVSVAPGEPLPGLPPFVGDLLTALEMYDSAVDASDLARSFGVELTPIERWLDRFLAGTPTARV
jgi:uncharacterized protein YbjT (DUF2867 family)